MRISTIAKPAEVLTFGIGTPLDVMERAAIHATLKATGGDKALFLVLV